MTKQSWTRNWFVRSLSLMMLALGFGVTSPVAASAQAWTDVPLSVETFDIPEASSARIAQRDGREALCLDGEAFVRDVSLTNGSIAVDILNEAHRHFANLIFRAASRETYETAYLRMHKSRQFDAVQYTPHLNGETNWQLFGEAQASADFGDQPWITLRIDFAGDLARISVGTGEAQSVIVTPLTQPEVSGAIGLRTLFEGCFSNFRFSTDRPAIASEEVTVRSEVESGTITDWSLSQALTLEQWSGLDARLPVGETWSPASVEANGRLLISRYRRKPSAGRFEQNQLDGIYAGVAIEFGSRTERIIEHRCQRYGNDMAKWPGTIGLRQQFSGQRPPSSRGL